MDKLPDNGFIQIRVSQETRQGRYNDSLYYTPAEFESLTQEDLDKAVTARVDGWVAFVEEQSSKPPVEPSKEELEEQKAELEKQLAAVDAAIAAKEAVPIGDDAVNP